MPLKDTDDELPELPEPVSCPVCGGEAGELGSLGRLIWFRCRCCGMEFNRDPQAVQL
jgi:tRNA(Ile2) C34 agmatinyltransferase TiaS